PPSAFRETNPVGHQATLPLPKTISLSADTTNISLMFQDYLADSVTDTKTVFYTVKANNLNKTTGVISAKLDTLFTNVEFSADPGAYTLLSGNAKLEESASGYITVDTAGVNLMNRTTVSGNGKSTRGSFPVTYQAKALQDLSADYNPTQALTITFADV
ncbi:MAG: hypothetical protein WCG06_06650, partial [Candidatus Omnitrophota bacterium]